MQAEDGIRDGHVTGVQACAVPILTVVSSVAVLSEVSGSNTPEVVLAVLEMLVVREESTFTTRVTDLLAPAVIVDRMSTRTHSGDVATSFAESRLIPAGIASDRLTPVASDGPLFVTVSV